MLDSNFINRGENKKDQKTKLFLICYFSWLGEWFRNITFTEDQGLNVNEIRILFDTSDENESSL